MQKYYYKIPRWLRNKYSATALLFLSWMLFFDQHDLILQYQLQTELTQLEDAKKYYNEEIDNTKTRLNELMSDDEKLEKFAREKYLMKKDNEDIFVITEGKKEE